MTPEEQAVATAIIHLMRGVVYREEAEDLWSALARQHGTIRDHFGAIGVDVVVNDAEGFAYLRSREATDGEDPLPRLVRRRTLTYQLSLLLVLLRKRMVEFEAAGAEGKLVLSRDQIVDTVRLFLAESTDEAKVMDQIDTTIRRAEELDFLRRLRGESDHFEVRRILKAYVDAQTLSGFADKLDEYAGRKGEEADD